MTPEQVTNAACEFVGDRLYSSVDRYAADLAADVQELVSVPVGQGPRGGKVRSRPGEPPRADTRAYLKSWRHRTTRNGDEVRGEASTNSPNGQRLEKGTSRMEPRPHVRRIFERATAEVVDRIRSRM